MDGLRPWSLRASCNSLGPGKARGACAGVTQYLAAGESACKSCCRELSVLTSHDKRCFFGGGLVNRAPLPLGAPRAGPWGGGVGACSLAGNLSLLLTVESTAWLPSRRVKAAEICERCLTGTGCEAPLWSPVLLLKLPGLTSHRCCSREHSLLTGGVWRDGSAATSHRRAPRMVPVLGSEPALGELGRGRHERSA